MLTVMPLPKTVQRKTRVSQNLQFRHVKLTLAARAVLLLRRAALSLCLQHSPAPATGYEVK